MADPFQPKFADLVRNYTTTVGTGNLVLGDTPPGFQSFNSVLQPGDRFYYSVTGVTDTSESEVGRGTVEADGTIAREPIGGVLTDFSKGTKTVALVAAGEWFESVDAIRGAPVTATTADALAGLPVRAAALLTLAGREGLFVFDPGDLSEKVTADPRQGLYVAPISDATGASGAWVRQYSGALNVKWFGASGDGVTDDTAAIQAALNLAARLKKALFFPAGTYICASSLSIQNTASINFDGLIVFGESPTINSAGTEIRFTATSGVQLLVAAESAASAFINRVIIRDITLKSNGGTATLLRLQRVLDVALDNVYLYGAVGASETLVDGNEWVIVSFNRCYFRSAGTGVKIVSIAGYTDFANVVGFRGCTFANLTTSTDFSLAGRALTYDICTWEPAPSGGASANLTGTYDTYFTGCWMGDADGTGTYVTAVGQSVGIINSEIISGATAVDVQTDEHFRMEGGRASGSVVAIKLQASRCTVRGVRTVVNADNAVCIDVISGWGQVLEDNATVVASGGYTGTIGYRLAAGTRGHIRDKFPGNINTSGVLVVNNSNGGFEVETGSLRMDGTITTNIGALAAGATFEITITVPGALVGDAVAVTAPAAIEAGLVWSGYVSANGSVKIRIHNTTAGAVDPVSATWKARVFRLTV